jgi:hypothetical protein
MNTCNCLICGKIVELKEGQINVCCNINYQDGSSFLV